MRSESLMRAIVQQSHGGPEVLELVRMPRPEPRANEILVRVHAASVNPTDWKHRENGGFLGDAPFVLGWDLSGVVEEVGIGVARFVPGDEVFGMLSYPFGHGSHADYVAAPARVFAKKPISIGHVEAAGLPLVSLTAWQALVENARLRAGQRVLIHAAAGGVGHVAVQIAKARGAHVIGTASQAKHDFVRSLGADEVIDYRTTDFVEAATDIDVVLDTIGADYSTRSLRTLRPGGIAVSILPVGSRAFFREAEELGVRALRMLVDADRHGLDAIAELVDDGRLRAKIAETFPLDQAADAHRLGETGRTAGKIVLTMVWHMGGRWRRQHLGARRRRRLLSLQPDADDRAHSAVLLRRLLICRCNVVHTGGLRPDAAERRSAATTGSSGLAERFIEPVREAGIRQRENPAPEGPGGMAQM